MKKQTKRPHETKSAKRVSDRGVIHKSDQLLGKSVALGVCGGIAAVETIKLARELRRHGASVRAFITPAVESFITRTTLEWATELPVVISASSDVEHLKNFDLVIIAPLTLNTLSKCALGLADNAVTLLAAAQLGRRGKLLLVPTMNADLWQHPAVEKHCAQLESWGAQIFTRELEEGRIKFPEVEALVARAVEMF